MRDLKVAGSTPASGCSYKTISNIVAILFLHLVPSILAITHYGCLLPARLCISASSPTLNPFSSTTVAFFCAPVLPVPEPG